MTQWGIYLNRHAEDCTARMSYTFCYRWCAFVCKFLPCNRLISVVVNIYPSNESTRGKQISKYLSIRRAYRNAEKRIPVIVQTEMQMASATASREMNHKFTFQNTWHSLLLLLKLVSLAVPLMVVRHPEKCIKVDTTINESACLLKTSFSFSTFDSFSKTFRDKVILFTKECSYPAFSTHIGKKTTNAKNISNQTFSFHKRLKGPLLHPTTTGSHVFHNHIPLLSALIGKGEKDVARMIRNQY